MDNVGVAPHTPPGGNARDPKARRGTQGGGHHMGTIALKWAHHVGHGHTVPQMGKASFKGAHRFANGDTISRLWKAPSRI